MKYMLRAATLRWRLHFIWLMSAIGIIALAGDGNAHPHVSIKLLTTIVLDDNSAIDSLRLEWMFDDEYSATIADRDLNGFAATSMKNLKDYGYFVDLRVDGARTKSGDPVNYTSEKRGRSIVLSFTLPLLSSVNAKAHSVTLSIYDPTYYIDMYHESPSAVTFAGDSTAECDAELQQQQPPQNLVDFAAALDRSETAPAFLGRSFADVITITCH